MKTINVGEVTVFDHVEPNKEQALKPLEEAAEVFGAWQEWEETKSMADRVHVISEIADTIQACVNLAAAMEYMGIDTLEPAMNMCKKRNIERGRITEENPEVLDADGEPIRVGDKLYFIEGDDTPLKCIGFDDYDNVTFTDWEKTRIIAYENPTVFTHKKPDSWEQLGRDVKLCCCEYFGRSYKECSECKADDPNHHPYDHPYDCDKAKTQDIIHRAKALAGVDDE